MRPRSVMLCSALSAVALAAAPGLANAAPVHNRGLTINATPNPIDSGDPVLLYGQLNGGTSVGNQKIVLYHHVNGSHRGYTVVGRTTTNSFGFYEFTRADGIVDSNRSWFVRLQAHPAVHSRTVYERVRALVSLNESTATGNTRQSVFFFGHVDPRHAGERIYLQQEIGSSDDWRTIKTGRLTGGSNYLLAYHWSTPGSRTLRAVFAGDYRNIRGESDPVTVTIQQSQNATFTINTASSVIPWASSAKITGTLDKPGTAIPEPNTAVKLCHGDSTSATLCDQAGLTDSGGNYSFTVAPTVNQWYRVRTVFAPHRETAPLLLGVKDIITLGASSSSVQVGQPDTFSGTVTPNKAGHIVYLQQLGADNDWHTVKVTVVRPDGTYSVNRSFGSAGTRKIRTRILGGDDNVGAVSTPVSVTVTPTVAISQLPTAQ